MRQFERIEVNMATDGTIAMWLVDENNSRRGLHLPRQQARALRTALDALLAGRQLRGTAEDRPPSNYKRAYG